MCGPYQILIPLLSLFLVRVDLTDLYSLKIPMQVMEVHDGDTVSLKYGAYLWKLRLSRIDAPEMKQPFMSGEAGAGKLSRECLKKILKSQTTILEVEGFDIYGRILGNAGEANFLMIRNGCADLYPYSRYKNKSEKWQFVKAHTKARARHLGIWGKGGILLPMKWRRMNRFKKRT